jgi:hypothetical protein
MSETKESKEPSGETGSALARYMGGRYWVVNVPLRAGQTISSLSMAQEMIAQLNGRPRVPANTTIYRWIGGREILHADNKEYGKKRPGDFRTGGICRDKAFMSASKLQSYIENAIASSLKTQHVFEIITCENSQARDVASFRNNTAEAELIFPPDVKFHIVSKGNKKYGKKSARVWYLQELAEGRNAGGGSSAGIDIGSLD